MIDCNAIERILLNYVYEIKGSRVQGGKDSRGVFLTDLTILAQSTSRLSKLFTRERENLPSDYLKDKNLRNAYILYFLQANLYKIHIPLMELARHPANLFLQDRLRILDVGSGPGTAILGILDFFAKNDKKPFLEFAAVDSVAENLRDAEGLFRLYMNEQKQEGRSKMQEINITTDNPPLFTRGMGGCFSDECSLSTYRSSIEKIKKLPSGPFDIIVLSNLLSEIGHNGPERIDKRVTILKRLLHDFLSDNGSCIIIEPALRETSREMLLVRDRILDEGVHIYSPCFLNKHCPALDNPKDWCHEDIPWDPPELIKKIDKLTGLHKDSIKFSYLVIRKDKISLADLYEEPSMSEAITRKDENSEHLQDQEVRSKKKEIRITTEIPSPLRGEGQGGGELWRFSGDEIFRIVSEPLISKGKIEFYTCGRSGRNLVVRLDKDRSPLNKGFDEIKRGDVVLCKGVIVEEKRLKVNKETEIEILERHRLNILN